MKDTTMSAEFDVDYNVITGVRNAAGQEFRMETRGTDIIFSIIDNGKSAEFTISYQNKVMIEKLNKQFTDCSAHATTIQHNRARKGNHDINPPASEHRH